MAKIQWEFMEFTTLSSSKWTDYPIVLSLLAAHGGTLKLGELYELMKEEGFEGSLEAFAWLVQCEMVSTPGYASPEIRWRFELRKGRWIEVIGFSDYYAHRLREHFLCFEEGMRGRGGE